MIVNGVCEITPVEDDRPALDQIQALELRQAAVLAARLEELQRENPELSRGVMAALGVCQRPGRRKRRR